MHHYDLGKHKISEVGFTTEFDLFRSFVPELMPELGVFCCVVQFLCRGGCEGMDYWHMWFLRNFEFFRDNADA